MEERAAWIQPPRLRSAEAGNASRRATWLELFYDLVYVVAVAALAEHLVRDPTLKGALVFAALFLPVWWSWSGVTFYNDRFDTDDLVHRAATLLQMLGAAALALNVETAFESPGFALSYAGVRAILIAMYLRVARHIPAARPLARRYALGFSLAASLWVLSLFAQPPWAFVLWGVAMAIDLGTPLTARRHQAKLPASTSHLPERIGLFTILVLGEGVAAVVRGVDEAAFRLRSGAAAVLALALGFALWWVYFEDLDDRVVRRTSVAGRLWFYSHFPLVMGLTAAAVGVELLLVAPPDAPLDATARYLLGGSLALCLASLAAIHLATVELAAPAKNRRRAMLRLGGAAAALALALGLASATPLVFAVAIAAVGVAQVALDPPARVTAHAA